MPRVNGATGPTRRDDAVLHVITALDVGGAELALKRLVLSAPPGAARHIVVSLRDTGVVGRELQQEGIEVHAVGMRGPFSAIRGFVHLARLISRIDPAIVQTWMYHGDLFGGLAARLAGRRDIIWGIRQTGFGPGASAATVAVMRLCARLSFSVPRLIVCCAESARLSHVAFGYCEQKMRVIVNGFDLPALPDLEARRPAVRAEIGAQRGQVVIGMVGRFDPLKNHRGFVTAARDVARRHASAFFMLVGRGVERSNAELMAWIDEAGLQDRCAVLGERRDIVSCMAAMDVFCLPSLLEGFPNVVGEAMALGLPCVVTDAGDAASLVGDTGWVVPTNDPVRLAAALDEVVALGPERRREAGRAARARIGERFSMARTRASFDRAYAELRGQAG